MINLLQYDWLLWNNRSYSISFKQKLNKSEDEEFYV